MGRPRKHKVVTVSELALEAKLFLGALAPGALLMPEGGSVVEFAEANRYLTEDNAQPGLFRAWRYQVEPMEVAREVEVEEVVLIFGSQTGKSTIIENVALYWTTRDPGNVIWILPDDKAITKLVKTRLEPSIKASPAWRAELAPTRDPITHVMIEFNRMTIFFALSNSESDLASIPCKYAVLDEEDKMPASTRNEGSPYDQGKNRTRTFRGRSKILRSSTVTHETSAIWTAGKNAQLREWCVRCGHCGEWHPWIWESVKWAERPRHVEYGEFAESVREGRVPVWYECPRCRGMATEAETRAMEEGGEYRVCNVRVTDRLRFDERFEKLMGGDGAVRWERPERFARRVAYHKPSIATQFDPLRGLVVEFLEAMAERAQGSEVKLQNFWIHKCARPYTPKRVQLRESAITDRACDYAMGVVPEWTRFLSRGYDVQHGEFYEIVMAVGEGFRVHVVQHRKIEGGWFALEHAINESFAVEGRGDRVFPNMTLVDSGDGELADEVYFICNKASDMGLVRPCKGSSFGIGEGRIWKQGKPDASAEHGGMLVLIDSERIRDRWAGRIGIDVREPNAVTFHTGVLNDEEFQRQMVSEEKRLTLDDKGRRKMAWVRRKNYPRNHFFDTTLYALAAAYVAGAGELLKPWREQAAPEGPSIETGDYEFARS